MKELIKKIAISGSGLALLAGTAFASVGNSGTGENSLNRVDFDSRNKTEIETTNHATVNNDVDVTADTGRNEIKSDSHKNHCEEDECRGGEAGDKTINTGDADASATVTNKVNRTTVDATMPGMAVGDVGNMNTGKNSENCVDADMHNTLSVETNNNATVHNDVDVTANTGRNTINSSGRGDATITTGNASASASVTNEVNTTSVTVR